MPSRGRGEHLWGTFEGKENTGGGTFEGRENTGGVLLREKWNTGGALWREICTFFVQSGEWRVCRQRMAGTLQVGMGGLLQADDASDEGDGVEV